MKPPTVEGAIEALRNFEGHVEAIHQIYLIDSEAVLKGAVPIGRDRACRGQYTAGGPVGGRPDFRSVPTKRTIGRGSLSQIQSDGCSRRG